MTDRRRDEIAGRLREVEARIARAAEEADRDPASVTLVVVTKTFPVADVRRLAELGVRDVGENRHPEAGEKAAALAELDLCWHFVGQVQSNKAARIASYADVVHSVDSTKVVDRLSRGALGEGRRLTCLVQVSLDLPALAGPRGGLSGDEVLVVADAIAAAAALELGGVMAVAPLGAPAAPAFARLADTSALVRASHPGATAISAGMSGDLEDAIRAGATHVRVGSAILGSRPSLG